MHKIVKNAVIESQCREKKMIFFLQGKLSHKSSKMSQNNNNNVELSEERQIEIYYNLVENWKECDNQLIDVDSGYDWCYDTDDEDGELTGRRLIAEKIELGIAINSIKKKISVFKNVDTVIETEKNIGESYKDYIGRMYFDSQELRREVEKRHSDFMKSVVCYRNKMYKVHKRARQFCRYKLHPEGVMEMQPKLVKLYNKLTTQYAFVERLYHEFQLLNTEYKRLSYCLKRDEISDLTDEYISFQKGVKRSEEYIGKLNAEMIDFRYGYDLGLGI